MGVIFLDPDDEITTAISRLRASQDIKVALVLPPGSRLGTSRINFRLLSREAQELPRQAAIVTTEAGVRAIAVSAGLPAYATVGEYEEAVGAAASTASGAATEPDGTAPSGLAAAAAVGAAGVAVASPGDLAPAVEGAPEVVTPAPTRRARSSKKRDQAAAAAAAAAVGAAAGAEAPTEVIEPTAAGAEAPTEVIEPATRPVATDGPEAQPTGDMGAADAADDAASSSAFVAEVASVPPAPRGPGPRSSAALPVVGGPVRSTGAFGGRGALVGIVAVIALVGIVAAVLAVFVLPQATITVAAPIETVGPVSRTVTADPTAIEPDVSAGIIPAELVTVPLAAEGEFTATGTRIIETKAKGTVTFSSFDTVGKRSIPAGSIVSTDSGVRFRTLAAANLPKAKIIGGTTIRPGTDSVRVEAVKAGTEGNVPANAIRNIPAGQDPNLIRVTNGNETSGGDRSETKRVSQEDVDVAVAELTKQLEAQMAAALADPATTPSGMTLVTETADTGQVKATPALDKLVGRNAATFKLALASTGQVIAVDTGVLEPFATDALAAAVPEGAVLFPESIRTTIGTPSVDGGIVSFEIGATGQAWRPLDEAALLEQVRGRSVLEAEDALAEYGEVTIDVWPFYVATIPDGDRATLTVVAPTPSGP